MLWFVGAGEQRPSQGEAESLSGGVDLDPRQYLRDVRLQCRN